MNTSIARNGLLGLLLALGACATPAGYDGQAGDVGESQQAFTSAPRLMLRDKAQARVLQLLEQHGVDYSALSGSTLGPLVESRSNGRVRLNRPVTDLDLDFPATPGNLARLREFFAAAEAEGLVAAGTFGPAFFAGNRQQAVTGVDGHDILDLRIVTQNDPSVGSRWRLTQSELQARSETIDVVMHAGAEATPIPFNVMAPGTQAKLKVSIWRDRSAAKQLQDLGDIATLIGIQAHDAQAAGSDVTSAYAELVTLLHDVGAVELAQLEQMQAMLNVVRTDLRATSENVFGLAGLKVLEDELMKAIWARHDQLLERTAVR